MVSLNKVIQTNKVFHLRTAHNTFTPSLLEIRRGKKRTQILSKNSGDTARLIYSKASSYKATREQTFLLLLFTDELNKPECLALASLSSLRVRPEPTRVTFQGLPSSLTNITPSSKVLQGSNQGILKGDLSLYHWPPVWLVLNQLYDYWNFLFFICKTD